MTNLASHTQQMLQDIRLTDESGFEFWSARALMIALGYKEWRKFEGVIERAKVASQNSGQREADHFVSSDKMVSL